MEDDEKKYFRIGAGLDCLLTSPERWDKDFIVVDVVRPYGLMGKFIEALPSGLTMDSPIDLYREAYSIAGYKMDLNKIIEKFWFNPDHVNYYIATRDKLEGVTILSKDEYESVVNCKELIMSNNFAREYFVPTSPYHEILRQTAIYFEYMGEECKALLDGILIDHENKTIQPYDLKTIGKSVYDFPISYTQFGYYRQAAFYMLAILSDTSPVRKYLDSGYKLLPFIFVVVESKSTSSHPAVIFKTCETDIKAGIYGGKIGRKWYKGVNELINAYKYHNEHDYWDLPKDLHDNKGVIEMEIFDEYKTAEEQVTNSPSIGS